MNAQIILRNIATAAADFVDLTMPLRLPRDLRNTCQARADPATIRFRANGAHLDPVVIQLRIATQELGIVVDRVDDHVDVAIVVEVAEGTASGCNWIGDPGPHLQRNVCKMAVAQVSIEQLTLWVSSLGLQLLNFGIHMPIADQDVGPAIVIEIEEAAAPA